MAGVITRGNFPKALWPGVREWTHNAYSEHPMECDQVFEVLSSDMAYEEEVAVPGFGVAPEKSEGTGNLYDSTQEGYTSRYTHTVFSLGFVVTREEFDDNKYEKLARLRSENIGFSHRQTREIVSWNVFNRAFSASYLGGDSKELCATDHSTLAGNQSNELATPADLSEVSIEDLSIQQMLATDERGLQISIKPRRLIVPPALSFEAHRIVKSSGQNDTANNATNAMKDMGLFPEGVFVGHYLTDTDAWFIQTDCPHGLKLFDRDPFEPMNDSDFDTENAKYKGRMRFAVGWTNWRGLYGSPGA